MNHRVVRRLLAILISVLLPAAAHSADPPYQFIQLPGLSGSWAVAMGINDANVIVGTSLISSGINHATLWRDAVPTELATPASLASYARAINEQGVVVGTTGVYDPFAGATFSATLWASPGNAVTLPSLGGAQTSPNDIDAHGTIVGSAQTSQSRSLAVTWNGGGLHPFGPSESGANAINARGQIVGAALRPDGSQMQAVLWNDAQMTPLETPTGAYSAALAINNSGVIAGIVEGPDSTYHAARWVDGALTPLQELEGSRGSRTNGINDAGIIVGTTESFPLDDRATAWIGGQVIDLNTWLTPELRTQGWWLEAAQAINNNGWIVGVARRNGQQYAFALAPVPEPACALLFGAGLMALALRRAARPRAARST